MVLDELDMSGIAEQSNQFQIKLAISALFWSWYSSHTEDHIITIKKWFFSHEFKVKDLFAVFCLLFGDPPTPSATT